jgi:hypothetical protein
MIRQWSLNLLKYYKFGRTLIGSILVLSEFHGMMMTFIFLTLLHHKRKGKERGGGGGGVKEAS